MVLLEKGFYFNAYLVLWYCSWVFFFRAFTPHVDCCVNTHGKPALQMIESSIVMDSRVGDILPSVSHHAAAKRITNTHWPSVIYLTCTCFVFNHRELDTMCFKQLLIILCTLILVIKFNKSEFTAGSTTEYSVSLTGKASVLVVAILS